MIVHGAGESSSEYQDLIDGSEVVDSIPGPDFWDPDQKNCLVIEEQPWGMFNRSQMSAAERCVNFTSLNLNFVWWVIANCPTYFTYDPFRCPVLASVVCDRSEC